jgi:hypothetical protein
VLLLLESRHQTFIVVGFFFLLCGGLSEPAVGPCLCDLVSGLVRKLQGTEAKVSEPDVQKNNSAQGSQMVLCPSDVNKKVMLTVWFSCFSVPVLKET